MRRGLHMLFGDQIIIAILHCTVSFPGIVEVIPIWNGLATIVR